MLDKRFKYKLGNTPILRLYRGTMWAEGPAWNGVGRYLMWSDIPNNEQLRWLEEDGHVSRVPQPGRQLQRQHLRLPGPADRVASTARAASCATSYDGSYTVLADKTPDGKRLNAPNDGAAHPDGGICSPIPATAA